MDILVLDMLVLVMPDLDAGLGHAYGGVHATNAALGHAVAYTPYGATHSANVGVCTNYLGAQVPC